MSSDLPPVPDPAPGDPIAIDPVLPDADPAAVTVDADPARTRKAKALKRQVGLALGCLVLAAGLWWGTHRVPARVHPPYRIIVLGFDGMDSELTERWMADGKLPNLQRLALANADKGLKGYSALQSTNPSESPVSWSSMITGQNPGKTNMYDFLRRTPADYQILNAMVDISRPAKFAFKNIPIKPPDLRNYRLGDPIWKITSAAGIRTTVLEAPVSFPPDQIPGGELIAGLGVGDLQGTQGTYAFYTTDPRKVTAKGVTQFGGRLKQVFAEPDGTVKMDLIGAPNRVRNPGGTDHALPVDLTLPMVLSKASDSTATLSITLPNGAVTSATLATGQWSDFIAVEFDLTSVVTLHGIFKVILTQYDFTDPTFPKIDLYVSPINFDPRKPPLPLSYPPSWSKELAADYGLFKTVGWPSETWGLNDGVLAEAAFLDDIELTQAQWEKMLFATLEKNDWDFCFAVTQQTDHVGHMFWRFLDPKSPTYDKELAKNPRYADAILHAYQRADQVVGKVLDQYIQDDRTVLLVVSDHGFNSFRRSVNINRWLINHGYMTLKLPPGTGTEQLSTAQLFAGDQFFSDVDWSQTRAYAMGLGQIYLNLKGREGSGIVQPGQEAEALKAELSAELLTLKDPLDGSQVMRRVFDGANLYTGPAIEQAPDLVMGFNDGYRVSWQTSLGGAPVDEIEDNILPWSGDHCSFDPDITMGICFTNWTLDKAEPSVLDIAPSILSVLGLPIPKVIDGAPLFKAAPPP